MADIESNCNFKLSDNDTAEISACQNASKDLIKEINDCNNKSLDIAANCDCFSTLSTANLDIVIGCKGIKDLNDAAKVAKKSCTTSMRAAHAGAENVILLL